MIQSFKKIGFAVLFIALTAVSAQAQMVKKMKLRKHECTEQCSSGKHMFKHGEKGHKCDTHCKTMDSTKTKLKDHVCTSACHSTGKCVMAHGEKGHHCDAKCKTH